MARLKNLKNLTLITAVCGFVLGMLPTAALGFPAAAAVIIPAVISGVGAGFLATSAALFTGLSAGVLNLGLGFAAQALAPKLKTANQDPLRFSASNRTTMIRQAITSHRVIYGEVRVGGPMTFYSTTEDNKFHHYVITLAGHEVFAIGTVFVNDYPVYADELDASGNVTAGRFNGKMRIKKHLGSSTQLADSDLVAEVAEWTTAHRGRGRAYIYIRIEDDRNVFPTGLPAVSAVVKGKMLFDPRTAVTEWSPNPALVLRDYFKNTQFGRGASDAEINDSFIIADANICDEFVSVKTVTHDVASVDVLANTFSLDGDLLKFQTGDRVQVAGDLPGGISALTDYFVIVQHAQKTEEGAVVQVRLAATYRDALRDIAIGLSSAGGGVCTMSKHAEPRYSCNGVIETDKKPSDIIEEVLTAMGGRATLVGGTWRTLSAVYRPPGLVLDEGDVVGTLKTPTRVTKKDRFNTVRGVYVSPINFHQPSDYPSVSNSAYVAQDKGEIIGHQWDLPHTTRSQTAQRLAKIELERMRQEITVQGTFSMKAFQLQPGDTVMLNNSVRGWDAKVFEVMESELGLDESSEDGVAFVLHLKLRETASAIYDFDAAVEEVAVDPAPNSNLPDVWNVLAPSNLVLTSGTAVLFLKQDGTVVSRIKAVWSASADAFVSAYEVQFRKSVDVDWQPATSPGTGTQTFIWDIEDGAAYDVRVRSLSEVGAKSVWLSASHTVVGKTEVPSNVPSFSAQQNGGFVTFRWGAIADADVGGYEIRYRLQGSWTWADATVVTKTTKGTQVLSATLPPGSWTLGIKAVDTSGNYSASAVTFNIQITNSNDVVAVQEEHPRWLGTLTNLILHEVSGRLVPKSQSLANAVGWEVFDQFVYNPFVECRYEGIEMDLGGDISGVRFWADMKSTLGPGASGVADPQLEIDYRLAADSYAGFAVFDVGEINARYIKPRVLIDTSTGAACVDEFTPTADVPERTERGTDAVIGTGGVTIPFSAVFNTKPNVVVQADGTAALFPVKSNVSTTSFKVTVYDDAGNDVGGTVDWQAIGS